MSVYSFTKTPVNIDRLTLEINNSGISSAVYQYANVSGTSLDIYFDTDLSGADQTTLSDLVIAHNGLPIYVNQGLVAVADGQGGIDFVDAIDGDVVSISGSLYSSIVSSTTLAAVQIEKTTTYDVQTTWNSIIFDTTNYENKPETVEHDDSNKSKILIKESGTYTINYDAIVQALNTTTSTYSRVYKNGSTLVTASDSQIRTYTNEQHSITGSTTRDFVAGDYVELQFYRSTEGSVSILDAHFSIIKLDGIKGDKGEDGIDGVDGLPGTGSTINVKDEGTLLTNTPHTTFNFIGTGVTATDAGNGVANINITSGAGITLKDEGTVVTGGPHTTLNFTGQMVTATDAGSGQATIDIPYPTFGTWYAWGGDESTTSTNSVYPVQKASLSVTGIASGYYRIGWFYEWRRNTGSNDYRATIVIDGTTTIMEHSQEPQDAVSWHLASGFYISNLSAGNHSIILYHYGESTGNTSYTRRARIELWRVA